MKVKSQIFETNSFIKLASFATLIVGVFSCMPGKSADLKGSSSSKNSIHKIHNALFDPSVSTDVSSRNKKIIEDYFDHFSDKKGIEMSRIYADQAVFNDSVFTSLKSQEVQGMWQMLTASLSKSPVWNFKYEVIEATGNRVTAKWTATYAYSATGNTVVNNVRSSFMFKDNKVVSQIDHFDFGKWVKQAMGPVKGTALNNKFGQSMIQKKAREKLSDFMKQK